MENNSMEQIIAELSKIEAAAVRMQDETEREKDAYAKVIEQKTIEFDEKLESDTAKRLKELEGKLEAEKKEEMSAMRADILKQTTRMEEIYEANCDKWVSDIVSSIIKE